MGAGTDDRGTFDRALRTLVQPKRCTVTRAVYEAPTYARFVESLKRWIRSCVEEGRENELLDNNPSVLAMWEKLRSLPTSMDLERGRSIRVTPRYTWEPTTGSPFLRTTKIEFLIEEKHYAPPIPQYVPPPDTPAPGPIDPCSRGTVDCKPKPPKPPPTDPQADTYYYCSTTGVRSLQVKKGITPQVPPDARSTLFRDEASAAKACLGVPRGPDYPPVPWQPGKDRNTIDPTDDDDDHHGGGGLSFLKDIVRSMSFFGAVIFFGGDAIFLESVTEIYELQKELRKLFPGQKVSFAIDKSFHGKGVVQINVVKDGRARALDKFIDGMYDNGTVGDRLYEHLKLLANDIATKVHDLEAYRTKTFLRKNSLVGTVRGYFIEDVYIQEQLVRQGYVGLPDYFPGFDAYKQWADFTLDKSGGKLVSVFNNPGVISIKSYEPGSLRNIDMDYLKRQLDESWLPKMDRKVFAKRNIRIVNPREQEIHLVLVGDEDASEFLDKVKAIKRLGRSRGAIIKVVQYSRRLAKFFSL